MGWHEKVLESADRAIAMDAKNVTAHVRRGMALLALGRNEDALEAPDRAIWIDWECLDAHRGRSDALLGLGRHAEALSSYGPPFALTPITRGRSSSSPMPCSGSTATTRLSPRTTAPSSSTPKSYGRAMTAPP